MTICDFQDEGKREHSVQKAFFASPLSRAQILALFLCIAACYVDNSRNKALWNPNVYFHSFYSVANDSKACMEIHSPSCRVTTFSKNMSSRELCISAVAHLFDDFVQRF